MTFPVYELSASIVLAAGFWFVVRRWCPLPDSRGAVRVWCAVWILAMTAPAWFLGPFSFNPGYDLRFPVPVHQVTAALAAGTKFAHAFAGGTDIYGLGPTASAGQYVSLERFLATVPPVWLGLAAHRVLTMLILLTGVYRLARALGASRTAAFAAAALISQTGYLHQLSFTQTTSAAVLPLALYLLICRQGRRFYWTGAAALGAWCAASISFPMSAVNLFVALPFTGLFMQWRKAPRFAAALAVVLGLVLLNTHEQIYGIAQLAAGTFRAGLDVKTFTDALNSVLSPNTFVGFTALAGLAAFAFIWAKGRADGEGFRAALCVLLYPFIEVIVANLPYELMGLGVIKSAGWHYLSLGYYAPAAVLVIWVLRRAPVFVNGFAALGAGRLAVYTAVISAVTLSTGGYAAARLESIVSPPWKSDELVRAALFWNRISSNQLPVHGHESTTGYVAFEPRAATFYWQAVNAPGQNLADMPPVISTSKLNFSTFTDMDSHRCCAEYDLAEFNVDVDLLRLSNTGFLVSRLALRSPEITQVAGPADKNSLPLSGAPYPERIIPYIKWMLDPPPPYVYALESPLPRIYAPGRRTVIENSAQPGAFMAAVRDHALEDGALKGGSREGGLVLRVADAETLGPAPGRAEVVSFEQILNGYNVTLNPADGAGGAAVILNVVYTRFWRAYADGVLVPLVQANQIQMAAAVPPGTRSLTFRYERPLLREKLFSGGS